MHAYDPSTLKVEAEITEVQGHSQLYTKFKATLRYLRPCLKRKGKKRKKKDWVWEAQQL